MPLQLVTGKISAISQSTLPLRAFATSHSHIPSFATPSHRCHVGTHCYPYQCGQTNTSACRPVSALPAIFFSYTLSRWLYTPLAQLTPTASACSPQCPFSKISLSPDFSTTGESSCDQCPFPSSSRSCQPSKCISAFLRPCEGGWCLVEPPLRHQYGVHYPILRAIRCPAPSRLDK